MMIRRRTQLVLRTKFAARTFLPIAIACAALSGCTLTKKFRRTPTSHPSRPSRANSMRYSRVFLRPSSSSFPLSPRKSATIATTISWKSRSARSILRAAPSISTRPQARGEIKIGRFDARDRLYLEVLTRELKVALEGYGSNNISCRCVSWQRRRGISVAGFWRRCPSLSNGHRL